MSYRKASAQTLGNKSAASATAFSPNLATTGTGTGGGGTLISTLVVADQNFNALTQTVANTSNSTIYISLLGSGFVANANVYLLDGSSANGTVANSTTFVNSGQLNVIIPGVNIGLNANTNYVLYVTNPDKSGAVYAKGVTYGQFPYYTSQATVSQFANTQFAFNITASSDSNLTFSLAPGSSIPSGTTLSSNGYFYGNVTTSGASSNTYNFSVVATNTGLQANTQPITFNVTVFTADPFFNVVTLLLGTGSAVNGANNNVFLDSSNNAYTLTPSNTVTQGSFSPLGPSNWSNWFDGAAGYHSLPLTSDFNLYGNFTVECWVYPETLVGGPIILSSGGFNSHANWELGFSSVTAGVVTFQTSNGSWLWQHIYQTPAVVTANAWTHIAAVNNNNNFNIYINGVSQLSVNPFGPPTSNIGTLYIGTYYANANYLKGYLSNLRITNSAVYGANSNFTPSTVPLVPVANTVLLVCNTPELIDSSNVANPLTYPVESVYAQSFSPFLPTTLWTPLSNTGSIYLGGTQSYLKTSTATPITTTANTFTIEGWLYPTALPTTGSSIPSLIGDMSPTANTTYWSFGQLNNNGLSFYWNDGAGKSALSPVSKIVLYSWNHIAMVANNNVISMYVNGTKQTLTGNTTLTNRTNTNSLITLGQSNNGSSVMQGYVSNFRITSNTALYNNNFTIPTAPVKAIANTQLLLNGTNAGIYDLSMTSNPLTSGNTQLSATQTLFANATMKFSNTTSDYLSFGTNPSWSLYNNPWSMEFWVYPNGFGTTQYLIDTRSTATSTTGVALFANTGGNLGVIINNGTLFTSSTPLSTNTWTFVSLTSTGAAITLNLNGTKPTVNTGTYSTSLTDQNLRIGATAGAAPANFFNGYMSNIRITYGIARSNTVPSQPFPPY